MPNLFSAEQKKATQGFSAWFSDEGERYMASEKQVRSSFSSSVLETHNESKIRNAAV